MMGKSQSLLSAEKIEEGKIQDKATLSSFLFLKGD